MKKILLPIISIIVFFIYITPTNAEKVFKYDWQTDNQYLQSDYTLFYNNNTYYQKGYVTSTINLEDQDENGIPKTYIYRYNIQGELLKTNILESKMILSMTTNDKYIVALIKNYLPNQGGYYISLLNEELEIIEEFHISLEDDEEIDYILEEFKILGLKYINILDNNAYIYTSNFIKGINLETGKIRSMDPVGGITDVYYKHIDTLEKEKTETKTYLGYEEKNNKIVLTGMDNQGCIQRPVSSEVGGLLKDSILSRYPIFTDSFIAPYVACNPEYKAILKIYDKENVVLEKTYEDYSLFSTPHIINNYIVTIATKIDYDTYNFQISILVLDMEGNILQEIKEEDYYLSLVAGPTSFMTIGTNPTNENKCYTDEKEISYNCFKNNNIVYYLPLSINTKIEGEGTIEVPSTARYEELIKYYPIPEENHSLENLTIIDSLNNEISYNNNTFQMPETNVTIIATFGIENPPTSDSSKIILISILLITSIISLKLYKRKREIV